MNSKRLASAGLLRQVLAIAVPVALQNVVTVGVGMADTVMLGALGEASLSASSLANQMFFVFTLVCFGLGGGSNVMAAQYWGKGDTASIKKVLAYSYRVVLAIALAGAAVSFFAPAWVMRLFTTDSKVIELGAGYLRIISVSFCFFGISSVTGNVLRAVHSVRISLAASIVSMVVNIALNWVFIFGKLGAPAMGVRGAALATTVARICEFAIIIGYMRLRESKLKLRLAQLLHTDRSLLRGYLSNCIPVMCNELLWSLGASMLTVVVGRMGVEFVSANGVFNVCSQLTGVMAMGVSSAAAVLVGNTVGGAQFELLPRMVRTLQWIGAACGAVSMVLILLLRPLMPYIYTNFSPLTLSYLYRLMTIGALMEIFNALDFVNLVGILRGGGDARFVLFNDICFLWLLAVPLGFLCGLVWKLPVPLVFVVLRCDLLIKLPVSEWRIRSKRWIKDVTALGVSEM